MMIGKEGGYLRKGLKLWSVNLELIPVARQLHKKGIYDYLELYVVPETFVEVGAEWGAVGIPIVLHAPHFSHGFNLSLQEKFDSNKKMWQEVVAFRNLLDSEGIIVHLGVSGSLEESIRQLNELGVDESVWVENKPRYALDGSFCVGVSSGDILSVRENCEVGFCLDFAHAVYLASALRERPEEVIGEFLELNPNIFHICDGRKKSTSDIHLNFGSGDFDLESLVHFLPPGARVTLETPKSHIEPLAIFEREACLLDQFEKIWIGGEMTNKCSWK